MTAADKKKISQRSKKGETLRWNAKKKSGWIYDGTWWRHYRQGKPTGRKEKHRISAKSPVAKTIGRAVNLANPFHKKYEHVEIEKKRKAERKAKRQQKEKLKLKKDKESVNEVLNQKPVKKKTNNEKTRENIQKSREVIEKYKNKNKPSAEKERLVKTAKENINKKKTTTTSDKPKKRMTAREKLRAKNVERFGQEHVDKLRAKHADFKKMKKREISKADFIKKYPKSQTAKRSRR